MHLLECSSCSTSAFTFTSFYFCPSPRTSKDLKKLTWHIFAIPFLLCRCTESAGILRTGKIASQSSDDFLTERKLIIDKSAVVIHRTEVRKLRWQNLGMLQCPVYENFRKVLYVFCPFLLIGFTILAWFGSLLM